MGLMVTGKLLNVQVPIVFKYGVDMLTDSAQATAAAGASVEPTTGRGLLRSCSQSNVN